jgi:hypothetical protein
VGGEEAVEMGVSLMVGKEAVITLAVRVTVAIINFY